MSDPIEINGIKDYLTAIFQMKSSFCQEKNVGQDLEYKGIEDFVLRNGIHFTTIINRPKKVKRGQLKQCFYNCFNIIRKYPKEFTYVEGFINVYIPIHHAWIINKKGEVIEPTLEKPYEEYFGVPFKWEYVLKCALQTDIYGSLLDPFSGNKDAQLFKKNGVQKSEFLAEKYL